MAIEFKDSNLIFLISQQRAGSTLLQRILAGHPTVHTTAEPWLMLHPVYALRAKGYEAEYNALLAHQALDDFLDTLDGGATHYDEGVRRMALHLYGTACEQAGKAYFLDKTPRYHLIIPDLARIFPAAKFILLLRNPLAVLNSILDTWVKGHWSLLGRYRLDLIEGPRQLLAGIELLGERAIVVRYQDLVARPEAEVESICRQLGLAYDASLVEYGRHSKPEGGMGDPTGVDQHTRPSSAGLDRWLKMGETRQTRHFAQRYLQSLGPGLLAALGYDYADLAAKLDAVPCAGGKVEIAWQQVVQPDEAFQRRMILIELALLEHRRLVHAARRWRRSLRRR